MKRPGRKLKVLVVGELNLDLILDELAVFPEVKKEIIAQKMNLVMGSSSAIFACNLSTLGTDVTFLGKVGKDQFGKQVEESLKNKKVNTDRLIYSPTLKTGLTVAFSFKNERAMVTYPGAMQELTEKDVPDQVLKDYDHLHVSSVFLQSSLRNGVAELFRRAKKLHLTTSLDTQWDPEEKWDCDWKKLLSDTDIFLPNIDEMRAITGKKDAKSGINSLKEFSNTIVVKNGVKGCLAWDGGKFYMQPAFLNRKVMDTIGAGDSFNAGFIHAFLKNKTIEKCLELGAICGAVNTTAHGGTAAFSSKKDFKNIACTKFNYSIDDL